MNESSPSTRRKSKLTRQYSSGSGKIRTARRCLLRTASADLDAEMLMSAIETCKVVRTVIFDAERGGSPDQALGPCSATEVWRRCSLCFIDITQFYLRQMLFWSLVMTVPEAKEFLAMLKVNLTEEEMQYAFSNGLAMGYIGTNPAPLIQLPCT